MDVDREAEGYHAHQHRWFSAGGPTGLVRDEGIESQDAPPNEPVSENLVRAIEVSGVVVDGSDLQRADSKQGGRYDSRKAWDAALDAATMWSPVS